MLETTNVNDLDEIDMRSLQKVNLSCYAFNYQSARFKIPFDSRTFIIINLIQILYRPTNVSRSKTQRLIEIPC